MTNEQIMEIALRQSSYDCGCLPEDFLKQKNIITLSQKDTRARKYLPLPFACDMVSYGSNIVAQIDAPLRGAVEEYLRRVDVGHAFETPGIHILDTLLASYGYKVCFMAEYFLPDTKRLRVLDCPYEIRLLYPKDFDRLYTKEWSNALCEARKQLDVLAVGAYDEDRLIGLAGCSADCEEMYQIGVDVLPEYRRQGIAAALTTRLADEIFKLGKVPFYCAAWCNLKSVRNAIKCGFVPAWVELTARDIGFVNEMNRASGD
ncbi:MAG: GNAT family N-acetyltransferase [Clostridia bacterium]|nr:GNAT family N-acetyltransferase [Clostridia bacterium]